MAGHSPSVRVSRKLMPTPTASSTIELRDRQALGGNCGLPKLSLTAGLSPEDMRQVDSAIASRVRVSRRETLYRPGERFAALYPIRVGSLKTVVLTEDGREQIIGYHMAGEIVGFDGIVGDRYGCEVIALEDSEVCVLPFKILDELARDVPLLRRNVYRCIATDICRDQAMLLVLGSRCAEERVTLFLLDLSARFRALGYSSSEFILRMTREEIGSYLGLSLETISRLFSQLQEEGLIRIRGRAVKLLDLMALKHRVGQEH